MLRTTRTLARLQVGARPARVPTTHTILTDFYREEFLKHKACLERQREAYSECAIAEMEESLRRVMVRVDELCAEGHDDVGLVVSRLLQTFDGVTKLSAWSDPANTH